MNIGRVIGTVVATQKDETLTGAKLLVTQPLDTALAPHGAARVMVDTVGAGIGELVLYCAGNAARNAARKKDAAIDAAIVGIVDQLEVDARWTVAPGAEGEDVLE